MLVGNQHPVHYRDYLQLNKILQAQKLESDQHGAHAHDEMLFIITHQTYELWFKQVLFEVDSIRSFFSQPTVDEKDLGTIYQRLTRVIEIFKVLVDQITIMETMTPLDFLDFRNYLVPASGFQSLQFRLLEMKLGIRLGSAGSLPIEFYLERLGLLEEEKKALISANQEPGLLQLLEKWLERMPFLVYKDFNFWDEYGRTIENMLSNDQKIIDQNPHLNPQMKAIQLQDLSGTRENFHSLLNLQKHQELVQAGKRRLSQQSMLAALFIHLYRDEPILHLPFKVLHSLLDLDELLSFWRYRHALMAHRMLGTKIGTGGSSGHQYLKQTTENNRVFNDLYNLSTFLIPRSQRPILPPELKQQLGYFFQ